VRNRKYLEAALVDLKNAEIVPKAVADVSGEIVLCDDGESSVSHIDPSARNGTLVSMVSLDDFVRERGISPVAIKIDIEGFDILALRGCIETARSHAPVFLVEYNQEEGRPNTWQALQCFADENNYLIYAVSRTGRNLFNYSYTFSSHHVNELSKLDTKMVFLVPDIHNSWFNDFSLTRGKWTNKGLHSLAVGRLLSTCLSRG
jgi:FkbM family methyltransferase